MSTGGSPVRTRVPRLPALDGVRGLAFLMVFAFHAMFTLESAFGPHETRPFGVSALTSLGREGVPLFFVLSAFLVTTILFAEREATGRLDVRAFLIRRALRLLPLYFALLLLFAPVLWSRTPGYPAYLLLCGDLYHMAVKSELREGLLITLWSIGVEEKFYLAWSFTLAALTAVRADRERVVRAAWIAIGSAWLYRLAIGPFAPFHTMTYGPIGYLDCFGWGILLALGRLPAPRVGSATALALYLAGLWGAKAVPPALGLPGTTGIGIGMGLGAILAAALIAAVKDARDGWANFPALRWIGGISYGAYLFHNLVIAAMDNLAPVPVSALGIALKFAELAVTLALAALSFRYFEAPFLRLKARFARA